MKSSAWIILGLVLGLFAGGCKNTESAPDSSQTATAQDTVKKRVITQALPTGSWELTAVIDQGKLQDIPYSEWKVRLTFPPEGQGNVGIKSPCNSGGCGFTAKSGSIQFQTNCFFTEMYCEEEQRNIWQDKLVAYLHKMTAYQLSDDGNQLQLNGIESQLKFKSGE